MLRAALDCRDPFNGPWCREALVMSIGPLRIAIVNPNTTRSMTDAMIRAAAQSARPYTELIALTPVRGVPSIESHVDEVWGALSVLREVERCEALENPPDAYVIACFGDTGVPARRARLQAGLSSA